MLAKYNSGTGGIVGSWGTSEPQAGLLKKKEEVVKRPEYCKGQTLKDQEEALPPPAPPLTVQQLSEALMRITQM